MAKSVRDLIAASGLSEPSVYAGIKTGELPGYYVGRKVVIPDQAFEDFLHGRWVPKPRPLFPNGVKPLPRANTFLRKVSS